MTDTPSAAEVAKIKFSNLLRFTPDHDKVVQSLRFRDQDHSIKCGALLGFCGLMIASTLVQLSAGRDAAIHVANDAGLLYFMARVGLLSLFLAAGLSLWSISDGRSSYSDDPWEALLQLHGLLKRRSQIENGAVVFCTIGTACSLATLIGTLFQ